MASDTASIKHDVHTSGPWKVGWGILNTTIYVGDKTEQDPSRPIKIIGTMTEPADATLAGAAPALLAALEEMTGLADQCLTAAYGTVALKRLAEHGISQTALPKIHAARAAIAQAKGGWS